MINLDFLKGKDEPSDEDEAIKNVLSHSKSTFIGLLKRNGQPKRPIFDTYLWNAYHSTMERRSRTTIMHNAMSRFVGKRTAVCFTSLRISKWKNLSKKQEWSKHFRRLQLPVASKCNDLNSIEYLKAIAKLNEWEQINQTFYIATVHCPSLWSFNLTLRFSGGIFSADDFSLLSILSILSERNETYRASFYKRHLFNQFLICLGMISIFDNLIIVTLNWCHETTSQQMKHRAVLLHLFCEWEKLTSIKNASSFTRRFAQLDLEIGNEWIFAPCPRTRGSFGPASRHGWIEFGFRILAIGCRSIWCWCWERLDPPFLIVCVAGSCGDWRWCRECTCFGCFSVCFPNFHFRQSRCTFGLNFSLVAILNLQSDASAVCGSPQPAHLGVTTGVLRSWTYSGAFSAWVLRSSVLKPPAISTMKRSSRDKWLDFRGEIEN